MKKVFLFAVAVLFLLANTAMADSIAGKFGVTVRGGASYIFDSELTDEAMAAIDANKDLEADIGWTGGVGIMYGITDNLSVNFDVIYLQTDVTVTEAGGPGEATFATGKTVDFALGAQWRFIPKSRFVPYVGAGFDVLWNKIDPNEEFFNPGISLDVDPTYGAHLSAGADFFITPNIALNAEIRGLYSTKGDVTAKEPGYADMVVAKYNPTNISGFVGIRFFFP